MRYLLDTHTVLWFLEDSEQLSEKAAAVIENRDSDNRIVISVASLWEFTIKHDLGKLRFEGGVTSFRAMIDANGWIVLPIAQSHLENLPGLPPVHRDPFDRLLVATAKSEGIPIVTTDKSIREYDVPCVW
ncbi:MAG: type II toxin-antitoxin system VapC family toxin [Acidobacteriota bacterium]|jgi:PIN domain nuclease of toxin-antitoxin system|nr:type II toxin-antitoxin system VapC family toxin [Acidobacteriota bacterium]